jgi:O-antigen ligase
MGTIAFSEDELNEDDASSRGRLHFWRVALAMANDNPVLGVGHNAFNVTYDDYDFSHGEYGRGRAVHSTWLGVLAELGYVGASLFVLNFTLALHGTARVRRAAARKIVPAELGVFATALEASLVVFSVGGTFLSAQYIEMLWHLVGLSIALTAIAESAKQTATVRSVHDQRLAPRTNRPREATDIPAWPHMTNPSRATAIIQK